jgi:hypothetical protein
VLRLRVDALTGTLTRALTVSPFKPLVLSYVFLEVYPQVLVVTLVHG